MDNREKILQNAISLFSEYSYEGVGIKQIVDQSKITKPTLYYYFGSKEGLMTAILKEKIEPFLERIKHIIRYTGDVTGDLRIAAETYCFFALKNEKIYRLYKSMCAMPQKTKSFKLVKPYIKKENSMFRDLFKAISEDHGNIKSRYIIYAYTFKGTIEVYIKLVIANFEYKEEDLLYRIIHQFLHGIY